MQNGLLLGGGECGNALARGRGWIKKD